MTDLNQLLKQLPIGEIAKKAGIDEDAAEDAVRQVLPGLVTGLSANAADAGGASSLEKALAHHRGAAPEVSSVDTRDGEKIVRNVFGANKDAVAAKLADGSPRSTVTQDVIAKVLPIVAPIVLAWLANQFFAKQSDAGSAKSGGSAASGGIGDVLGGLLGGGAGSTGSKGSGGGGLDIGSILGGLGGLLGGGKR